MKNILYDYLLKNFLKSFIMIVFGFYCFGFILNLFEEIEFFKNTDVSIILPLTLTAIFIPSMMVKYLPFVIFISSMWFMTIIRNNKDLLTLKIYGFSNLKIFLILAFTSFFLGWIILLIINPITSSMSKYYEKTKSKYSRDIDHLVTYNKNGLWIKENLIDNNQRIISAEKPDGVYLVDVTIFHLNEKSNLIEKIVAKRADITDYDWVLKEVMIFKQKNNVLTKEEFDTYQIQSIYNYKKITNLFKNFDTMSFAQLVINYNYLLNNGYNKDFLNQSLHSLLSLPFLLLLMTGIAAILTMGTLKKSDNLRLIVLGLILCVLMFYFKDLSLALGQTGRIPLVLAVWAPVIALSLFMFIGVLQINEK